MWDDVYLISGTESAPIAFGIDFTATITDPLRRELDCRWPTSGTRVISTADHPDREIDFGDGECDNIATVTVDGDSFELITVVIVLSSVNGSIFGAVPAYEMTK